MEQLKPEFVHPSHKKDEPTETITVIEDKKKTTEATEYILIFFGVLTGGLSVLSGNLLQGIVLAVVLVGSALFLRKKRKRA